MGTKQTVESKHFKSENVIEDDIKEFKIQQCFEPPNAVMSLAEIIYLSLYEFQFRKNLVA